MRISYLALKSGFVRYSSIREWSSMNGFATTQILGAKLAIHKLDPKKGHNRAPAALAFLSPAANCNLYRCEASNLEPI